MKPKTISCESTSVILADSVRESWRSLPTDTGQLHVDIESGHVINADRTHLKYIFKYLFISVLRHADDRVAIRVGTLKDGFVVTADGFVVPVGDPEEKFGSRLPLPDRYLGFELAIVWWIVEAYGWKIKISDGVDGGVEFEIHC